DTKDLEAKLFVPERNNIIVQTYLNYVSGKRTVIFCASVANAEEIAYLLRKEGVKAEAVSGGLKKQKREKILSDYENGKIQVLCACDLLNEGWDSPKTEVLFMARPTMSKTIYMQQLGRGTRKAEGKDEILVFDFIDGANLYNTPLSAHRMFNMEQYVPGGLLVGKSSNMAFENQLLKRGEKPVELLDLPIDVKDMEYIDLFNWYEDAKNMISQIEFVRMVNVQGETVSKYIREGKILADLEVPCANVSFKYFKEESVKAYAEEFGWKLIDNNNLKDMFMEFVEKMDMSYSYKPVLLKGMIECMDDKGRVLLEELVDYFVDFYEERKSRGLEAEKKKSLYNEDEIDRKKALKNILSNPFKRFEDMRFMERCKDVEYVMFNKFVFKKLSFEDRVLIDRICDEKLKGYFKE
ncbi:MAG: DEAD/DEAH box helicase, partial [Clostridium sp.]